MGRPRSVRLSDVSFSVSHFRSAHALICTVCQSLPVFFCVFCCCFVLLTCSCKHLTAWPISFVGCLDYKPNSKSSVRTLCFSRYHLCFHSLPLYLSLWLGQLVSVCSVCPFSKFVILQQWKWLWVFPFKWTLFGLFVFFVLFFVCACTDLVY